jgi:hypothetical protein
MTGMSAFGRRVTGSLAKLRQPRMRRISEIRIEGSGRRIDQEETFMATHTYRAGKGKGRAPALPRPPP